MSQPPWVNSLVDYFTGKVDLLDFEGQEIPERLQVFLHEVGLVDGYSDLIDRQAGILTRTINLLRGKPPMLVSWSHHDVDQWAEKVMRELDELRCQVHGHDWVHEPSTRDVKKGAPMVTCRRRFCDEIGWRVDAT